MKKIASNRNYRLLRIKNTIEFNKLGQVVVEDVYEDPQTWGEYFMGGAIRGAEALVGIPYHTRAAFNKELLKVWLCRWANGAALQAAEVLNSKETIDELKAKGFDAIRYNEKIIAQCILQHCAPDLHRNGCSVLTSTEVEESIKRIEQGRAEQAEADSRGSLEALEGFEF